MATTNFIYATGRRKNAVARVRLFVQDGDGSIKTNDLDIDEYFPIETQRLIIRRPLVLTDKVKDVRIEALLDGGGKSGQAGALAHGISRALVKLDENLRSALKVEGCLTRDARMKERKKPGQPGARKQFQFSKR